MACRLSQPPFDFRLGWTGGGESRPSPSPLLCPHLLRDALDCLPLPLTLIFFFPSLFLNFLPAFHTKAQIDGGLSWLGLGWSHSRLTWGDASRGAIVVSPSSLFLLNSVTSQAQLGSTHAPLLHHFSFLRLTMQSFWSVLTEHDKGTQHLLNS